jgi:Na+/H+-dicarboxylate symporter
MIVVPLIIASMIVGVTSLGDIRRLGRTTGKTVLFYLATTGFSVFVGLILVNLIRPGVGVPLIGEGVPDFISEGGPRSIVDIIVSLVPDNIFGAAAGGQILPLIIFSLIFGGVLTAIGRKGRPVINFFEGVNLAIMKIVMLIIYFAPIGIFSLIGGIVAQNQASIQSLISALGLYALTVIIGLAIHATVTLPLILRILGRKNPFQYVVNMGQALATAFTTASSSATLPVTMECVEDKNKVDRKAASFVLPLGATINMDGTALYEAVAALFIAQIYGIDLSIPAQVIIFFTATLASIGAAAIPEAGLVMMTLVLSAVGLPLEGIGIILAIDWFLDRCRTTVNVWGDSVGAAVIGETAEMKQYRASRQQTKSPETRYDRSRTRRKPGVSRSDDSPKTSRRKTSEDRARKGRHDYRERDRKKPRKGPRSHSRQRDDRQRKGPRSQGRSRSQPETGRQTTPAAGDKNQPVDKEKGDNFFDAEFSKMELFDRKSKDQPEKTGDQKNQPDNDITDRQGKTADRTSESAVRPDHNDNDEKEKGGRKKSDGADAKKDENQDSSEDHWGRGRRRRPQK